MDFYKEAYPQMFKAIKVAKDKGHIFTKKAKRSFIHNVSGKPGYYDGPRWEVICDVCGTCIAATFESEYIHVGGTPLRMTCRQVLRKKERAVELREERRLQSIAEHRSANDGPDV